MTTGWNKNVKSALHHWWPQGVSRFWANQKGLVTRLSPDGITTEAPPKNFGAIRNAHQIVIRDSSNDGSVTYRESFEHLFNSVDRQFPTVIEWLKSLERRAVEFHLPFRKRFHVVSAPEDKLRYLIQGLFSLVVRSPLNRDACIAAAEFVRSHISKEEREVLITANLKNCLGNSMRRVDTSGKLIVCYSQNREFIFGDGFHHTISFFGSMPLTGEVLVPLTTNIAVLYVRPTSFTVEPQVMTLQLGDPEVQFLNDTIQIYAKQEIFFRSQCPDITEPFKRREHLRFADSHHWIADLVRSIPGIHARRGVLLLQDPRFAKKFQID
ncbi:MAG: hypothetical protein OXG05_11420 [Gammaproteobacteria bacterium]|nr:hypothetical protein [Gammaproteobacteria bacterium]